MINIKFKYIAISAYVYIILPIIIFFLTWLRWYVGMPMTAILLLGLVVLVKKDYLNNTSEVSVPIKHLILISLIIFIWTWLSGQGGFFYQTNDQHWRNAIFRDLIDFKWPVIYPETGNALVYYLMHWIVPAAFGKLFGWTGGNIALLFWTYVGLMITYLLILHLTKGNSIKQMWIAVILFITWSGLNNLGSDITNIFGSSLHPGSNIIISNLDDGAQEWWLRSATQSYDYCYQYSGNDTLLSWVYNQTIVPWIAIPLILENRKVRTFAFLGLSILPYAPIPFMGFLPIFIALAIPYYIRKIRERKYKSLFKETLSIPNLSGICTIFPVFWSFYGCNERSSFGLYMPLEAFDFKRIALLLLFYLVECGVYIILIYRMYKKDLLYYTVAISLLIIPIFRIGAGCDFCMRASIPALFILMILVIKYIFETGAKFKKTYLILVLVLIIGAFNPLIYYGERCMEIYINNKFPMVADDIKTLSDKQIVDKRYGDFKNFLSSKPESKFFYKYLAK